MYDERAYLYSKAVQAQSMREADYERLIKEATAGQPSVLEVVATKLMRFVARRRVTATPIRGTN